MLVADQAQAAVERIAHLARYVADHEEFTLETAIADIPEYRGEGVSADHEAIRRKFRRDLEVLRDQFGAQIAYNGSTGVYRRQPGWLTAAERRALLTAAGLVRVDGLGASPEPTALGAAIEHGEQPVVLAVHRDLLVLRDAIATRRCVRFGYRGELREVEPWAIGMWRRFWYLAGRDRNGSGERRFRLDRFDSRGTSDTSADGSIEVLEDSFTMPDELDTAALFDLDPNSWGHDPLVTAMVEVAPGHHERLRQAFSHARVVETGTDAVVVAIEVRDYQSFVDRMLCFGTNAVVREPEQLVCRITDALRALVEG